MRDLSAHVTMLLMGAVISWTFTQFDIDSKPEVSENERCPTRVIDSTNSQSVVKRVPIVLRRLYKGLAVRCCDNTTENANGSQFNLVTNMF